MHACVWPEGQRIQEQVRKAERNVYMKRPTADAVTRDSAHRPKERLPSPCFFPKLQPYVSLDFPLLSSFPLRFLAPAFWNALDTLPCVPLEDSLILSARESWRVLNGIAIPTRQMCKENRRGSTRYSGFWNVDVSVGHSACDMIYLFVCSFERERRRSLRN